MEDKKLNSKEIKEWDPLDTPQIANAEEVQHHFGHGGGEQEKTWNERLASVKGNINRLRNEIQKDR